MSRTYGAWKRPQSAGLFGLSAEGTYALIGALIFVVLVVMARGLFAGLIVAVPVGVLAFAVSRRDQHGSSVLDRLVVRVGFWRAVSRRSNVYRSSVTGVLKCGTAALPGVGAALQLSEHRDAYDRGFALVFAPASGAYTVVFAAEPDGASLVDEDQIDGWVAAWGQWLAALGDEPGVRAAAVTIETAPDPGFRLAQEIDAARVVDAPVFAAAVLDEVKATYPSGSSMTRAWVTVTFSALSALGRKRSVEEIGRDIGSRLPGLMNRLSATGAGAVRLVDSAELCEVVRCAYDPAVTADIEAAGSRGEGLGLSWSDCGPVAAEAGWDWYRHDSGVSVSWQMSGAPRGLVQSGVLANLLAPATGIDRKRVTILYKPIDAGRAAALVERDVDAARFVQEAQTRATARSRNALTAAQLAADEEAAGAGLVEFGMLVTATVQSDARLADARALIDMLAGSARVRLRPCYGSQDSAFIAGLPLGVILPDYLGKVAAVREKL